MDTTPTSQSAGTGVREYGSIASIENTDRCDTERNGRLPEDKTPHFRWSLHDREFRKKLLLTACIYFDHFSMAWLYGVVGPSLPDLQEIVGVDLQTGSWIITCFSLGYMVGCILNGVLYGRVDSLLIMAFCALVSGALWVATPWCNYFWLMLVVRFLGGIVWGGTDSVTHSEVFAIWGIEGGPWGQFLYVCFGLGGMGSALAVMPFLGSTGEVNAQEPWQPSSTASVYIQYFLNVWQHFSPSPDVETRAKALTINTAFVISGSIAMLASLPFVVNYFVLKTYSYAPPAKRPKMATVEEEKKGRFLDLLIIALLSTVFGIITGVIDTYIAFLVSFTIDKMDWSSQDGDIALTIFFIAFVVGNIASAMTRIGRILTSTVLIIGMLGSTLAFLGLSLSAIYLFSPGIRLFNIAVGLFLSPLCPGVFTYVEQNLDKVAGKIGSAMVFGGAIGVVVNPIIIGYTMEILTPASFAYIMLTECVIMSILLTIVFVITARR